METNCEYYLSIGTMQDIWSKKNTAQENKMLACLYLKKELFFSRVSYRNSSIQGDLLEQLLEDAFADAITDLMKSGRAGTINVKGDDILAYFFGMFKFKFFSIVRKENNFRQMKKEMGKEPTEHFTAPEVEHAQEAHSGKLKKTLEAMGETRCRDLLTWRYLMGLDYDEIVKKIKDEVTRASAIKMTSRCKESFRKIWQKTANE